VAAVVVDALAVAAAVVVDMPAADMVAGVTKQ
jgi:hypothetical protein